MSEHTERLMRAEPVAGDSRALEVAKVHLVGYKAIVEQLEELNSKLGEISEALAAGGMPLGAFIAIEASVDSKAIDHANLADKIAFALETRKVGL